MRRPLLLLAVAALLGGLLPPTAPPAAAQTSCPAPGGAGFPSHTNVPDGEVQVLGRGWGHGVGMSQYGARGAATLGCSAREILRAYYPGTDVTTGTDRPVPVSLFPNRPGGPGADFFDVYAASGNIQWQVSQGGTGAPINLLVTQRQGTMWRAVVVDDPEAGPQYVVADMSREGEIVHRSASTADALLIALENRNTIQLPQKPAAGWPDGRPYRRGVLRIRPGGGSDPLLSAQLTLPNVEEYLYGLAEMPSSWAAEALKVQAIAGRSYALRNNRALLDTPGDQVYAGLVKEIEPSFGTRWVAAVNDTRGQIVTYQGQIAQTFYSSSHGGQSESNRFSAFFSADVTLPYLVPIDDTRWEAASSSPVATWSHAYTRAEAGALLGVGEVWSIRHLEQRGSGGRNGVPGRAVYSNPSARYGGMEVVGTTRTRVMSGLEFVQALNVTRRSELFQVTVRAPSGPPPPPAAPACEPLDDLPDDGLVQRLAGPGRIETAVAASQASWLFANEAVLATAGGTTDGFADALSAAALAARRDAPLLLTGSSSLAAPVAEELRRLRVRTVHLMGGTGALSDGIVDELRTAGYRVERVAGPSRFDTAAAAARKAGASPSGDVALAFGFDWPDAVSAGALAASVDRVPTLLTLREEVPAVTLRALETLAPERVLLVGGRSVIADAVATQLRAAGYEVARRAGANRYETSLMLATDAMARSADGPRPVVLASGSTFPDALAAGATAAKRGAALVLAPRCDLDGLPGTQAFLEDLDFDLGLLIGGRAALSDRVFEQLQAALGD